MWTVQTEDGTLHRFSTFQDAVDFADEEQNNGGTWFEIQEHPDQDEDKDQNNG